MSRSQCELDSQQGTTKYTLGQVVLSSFQPANFGIVVTIYTLGGLLGSLSADSITRRFGRLGTLRVAETVFMLGAAAVGLGNAMWILIVGR